MDSHLGDIRGLSNGAINVYMQILLKSVQTGPNRSKMLRNDKKRCKKSKTTKIPQKIAQKELYAII